MPSLFTPTGMARQIPSAEAIIINLENIPFVTTLEDAELVVSGEGVDLWAKYRGEMVPAGRLFKSRSCKTVYARIEDHRYRMSLKDFKKVMDYPGFLAQTHYCYWTKPVGGRL